MGGKTFNTCKDCGVQYATDELDKNGLCPACAANAAEIKKPWDLIPCKGCNMLYPKAQLNKKGYCAKCVIEGK